MKRYLVLGLVALATTLLPLVSSTGRNLEYEFALVAALIALLALPSLGLWLPRGTAAGIATFPPAFELLWILLLGPLVALVPVAVMYAFGLCQCSRPNTAFWLLIQWYPAWMLGFGLMHGIVRMRASGRSRQLLALGLVALFAALTLHAGWLLWMHPQKRITHLFAGFLHGPIYDNQIVVDHGIVLARAAHFLAGALVLCAAWLRRKFVPILITVLVAAAFGTVTQLSRPYPSVQNGRDALDRLMPDEVMGQGFVFHYRRSDDADHSRMIHRIVRDTEFHLSELEPLLGQSPKPVHIYLYPDQTKKKLWFGGGATDVTDVVTPSIHITADEWPHETLRHELVHALAAHFGYKGLGFHPNLAFTEGLAMALAPTEGSLSLDEGAAELFHSQRMPPLDALLSPLFWKESGRRAYTAAGSIIAFLIQRNGIENVRGLYAGDTWDKAIGTPMAAVLEEWRQRVTVGYDTGKTRLEAEVLYRYPGVFNDLCPHSKATLNEARRSSPYIRLMQPMGWDPEAHYWPWRLQLDSSDRYAATQQINADVLKVAALRSPNRARLEEARTKVAAARHWPPKTLEDVELTVLESDLRKLLDDTTGSLALLNELVAAQDKHDYGESLARQIHARLAVEADPTTAPVWRKYLAGWRETLPDQPWYGQAWMYDYLRLRRRTPELLNRDLLEGMLGTEPPTGLPPTFAIEWFKFLALRFMEIEAYDLAQIAYGKAVDHSGAGSQAVLKEHQRRAAFYQQQGKLALGD